MSTDSLHESGRCLRKSIRFLAGLSLLAVSIAGCGGMESSTKDRQGQQVSAEPATILMGDTEAKIDVGVIDSRESSSIRFFLENKAAEEIRVESVKTTCGCLKANKYPNSLQAGTRGEMKLSVDSRRPPGQFHQSLYVFGKTPSGKEVNAAIRLYGFVRGVLIEQSHVRLGTVSMGHHFTISGTIVGHPEAVEIDVSPSNALDVLNLSVNPAEESALRSFHARLVVREANKARTLHEHLSVKVTTATATYDSSVLVTGQVPGTLIASPSALVFNLRSKSEMKNNRSLIVSSSGKQQVIGDLKLEFDRDLLGIAVEEQNPHETRYRVTVNPLTLVKPYSGAIEVLEAGRHVSRVRVLIVP
jgi:hypothetical protein